MVKECIQIIRPSLGWMSALSGRLLTGGSHPSSVSDQRLSSRRAVCPASLHLRLRCATLQSSSAMRAQCPSTVCVHLWIRCTHVSSSIFSSSWFGSASSSGSEQEPLLELSSTGASWLMVGRFQKDPSIHRNMRRCVVLRSCSLSAVMVTNHFHTKVSV